MRLLIYLLFSFICLNVYSQTSSDDIYNKLDEIIENSARYDNIKKNRILQLKKRLMSNQENVDSSFQITDLLIDEYETFIHDSAYFYTKQLCNLSAVKGKLSNIAHSKSRLGYIYLASGLIKEAIDTLLSVNTSLLNRKHRITHFGYLVRAFLDIADYADNSSESPHYREKSEMYIDSLLNISQKSDYEFYMFRALKFLNSGDMSSAKDNYNMLLKIENLPPQQVAITYSMLAFVSLIEKDKKSACNYYALSAITDIENSIKENSALFNLARYLYESGDKSRAYIYAKKSLQDAEFYNARQRKYQISTLLPIIEGERLVNTENQRDIIKKYLYVISFLALMAILATLLFLRLYLKLKKARGYIVNMNCELSVTNDQLKDSNRIKEKYIGYFFNSSSAYYDKLKQLKTKIEKHIEFQQKDLALQTLKSIDLKKEKRELLQNFDKAFLELFPGFVGEFNRLMSSENRYDSEVGQLNTDLRIFALIRLGINDNEKIAQILNYSVNTIYTYKTKVKKGSSLSNEEFDRALMRIKSDS